MTWLLGLHAETRESLLAPTVKVFLSQVHLHQVEALIQGPDLKFTLIPATPTPSTFLVKPAQRFQKMNGFGAAMTESCALNLMRLTPRLRAETMHSLFSKTDGAGFDYLRLPMGASDFSDPSRGHYTYDDSPGNVADPQFKYFTMHRDDKSFRLIRQARRLNPDLKVMISPWSPPAWMKTPPSLKGGSLNPQHYQDYANYFIRVIRAYQLEGVPVGSLTIQNEPGYPNDSYPSMGMTNDEQIRFTRDFLAPALRRENLPVGIFVLDHNYDMFNDVNALLDDPSLKKSVAGTAYHCYVGDYTQMLGSILRHPDLPVFQTECTGMQNTVPEDTFAWWLDNYSIRPTNIGSIGSIAWNLCLDQSGGPHDGGCYGCSGLVTTDFSKANAEVRFNPEYHAFAQISRFIRNGSQRIGVISSRTSNVSVTAFINPDNRLSFIAWNPDALTIPIRIQRSATDGFDYNLQGKSAVTFTWREPAGVPSPMM